MNTIHNVTLNHKSDVGAFINDLHQRDMFIYKCIGFRGVISIKDSKLHSFRKEVETKIGYPNARPHMKTKRIGINKYSIELDCSLCPNVLGSISLEDLSSRGYGASKHFWNGICEVNKVKLFSYDHVYEIESIVNEDAAVQRGKAYVAMTDAWRQAIGDGHRGQKYKTKALEGITWKWGTIGNKKVKLLMAE